MNNLELLQRLQQQTAGPTTPPQQPLPQAQPQAQPQAPQPQPGLVADTLQGVAAGARDFAQSTMDLGADLIGADAPQLPEVADPERLPGRLLKPLTQFGLAFLPANRALRVANMGKTLTAAAAGAVADFVAFDEAEARLSDVLTTFDSPLLNNAITQYLSSDQDDSWAEGRFKNSLEGAGLGAAVDLMYRGVRMLKFGRSNPEILTKEGQAIEEGVQKIVTPNSTTEIKVGDAVNKGKGPKPKVKGGRTATGQGEALQGAPIDKQETVQRARTALGEDLLNDEDVLVLRKRVDQASAGERPWREVLTDMPLPSLNDMTSDQAKVMVDQIARSIRKSAGDETLWDKPQTIEAVKDLAGNLSMEPELLLRNLSKLGDQRDEVAAQMMAGVGWVNRLGQMVLDTSRAVDAGKAAPEELDQLLDVTVAATKALRESGSTLGRGLNVLKYNADAPNPTVDAVRQLAGNLAVSGDKKAFLEGLKRVQDPGTVAKLMHQVARSRTWNIVNEYWINALLSGPKTHAVNIASNAMHSIVRPLEEGIGGVLVGDRKAIRRMAAQYSGMLQFAGDALKYSKIAWQHGDNVLDPHMSPVGELPKAIPGKLGEVVRTPTRALLTEDEFFKQINYRSRVRARAVESGLSKGLRGADLRQHVQDTFDAAFDENGRALDAEALRYAEEVTFTNPLNGGIGQGIQRLVEDHPVLRQVMPFVRTPTNLFRQALRHVPGLGIFQRDARRILRMGSESERGTLVGQQILGTSIMLGVSSLAMQGRITGSAPKDPSLREAFYAEKQPYSIRIGDGWYSYDRLDPLGMLFGVMADLFQTSGEMDRGTHEDLSVSALLALMSDNLKSAASDPGGTAGAALAAVSRNVVSKTYLQSMAETLETLNSGEEWQWKKFINNRIGSFVPNILRQVNTDPVLREVRTAVDAVMSRIPGYSETVEPRFNFLGRPITRSGHPVVRALSPVQHFVEPNHPVWSELERLGQGFLPAQEKLGNVDLTQFRGKGGKTAYYRYNELIQQSGLEDRLTKLVQSPGYQGLSDNMDMQLLHDEVKYKGSKIGAIQKFVDQSRQIAKARLSQEQFVSREGRQLSEALLNDRVNRAISRAPGSKPRPIQ